MQHLQLFEFWGETWDTAFEEPEFAWFFQKMLHHYGNPKYTIIGHGNLGIALDLHDGRVLKISSDRSEAYSASKLLGKKTQHLVTYHEVKEFRFMSDNWLVQWWVMIMDKVDINPTVKSMVNGFLFEPTRKFHAVLSTGEYDPDEARQHYDAIPYQNTSNMLWMLQQLSELTQELNQHGLPRNEVRGDNLGIKNQTLVMFDIGNYEHDVPDSYKPDTVDLGKYED